MTDRKCPLGEECEAQIAWLAGAENQREHMHGRIEELTLQLGLARIDADQQRARAEAAEAERDEANEDVRVMLREIYSRDAYMSPELKAIHNRLSARHQKGADT